MQMYETVSFVPPIASTRGNKFLPVFKKLSTIPESKFLPVACSTVSEATYLMSECRRRNITAHKRQKVVYLQGCAVRSVEMAELAVIND